MISYKMMLENLLIINIWVVTSGSVMICIALISLSGSTSKLVFSLCFANMFIGYLLS